VGVKINPDLSVLLLAPTVETGTGSNHVALAACAEALNFLGISMSDVHWVEHVDTNASLKDTVQTDSAVSLLLAEALVDVAAQVKKKVLDLAGGYYQVPAEALDVTEGRVFFRNNPDRSISVKDLLWWHVGSVPEVPITVTLSRGPNPRETGVPYQATFAEVEVDVETGEIKVLRLVVVNDAGTVLNPTGAEAQQIGGQTIGLGETLSEEIVYDKRTGVPLGLNFIDYRMLTMADLPEIEPVLLEVWQGAGEYGAAGIAEGVLTNTPAAILNAVYNAIGVRIDHIPVREKEILEALHKNGSGA
jgi:xanthine dehydrogenase molybdenum-binding subunit